MNDHATHRLLGEMVGKLEAVEKALSENEERARESREKVYSALEEIRSDAQDTRKRVGSMETTLEDEVKPVVRGVLDWRSRAIGAAAVLGLIGSMLVLALTAAKELVLDIWRLLVNR